MTYCHARPRVVGCNDDPAIAENSPHTRPWGPFPIIPQPLDSLAIRAASDCKLCATISRRLERLVFRRVHGHFEVFDLLEEYACATGHRGEWVLGHAHRKVDFFGEHAIEPSQ